MQGLLQSPLAPSAFKQLRRKRMNPRAATEETDGFLHLLEEIKKVSLGHQDLKALTEHLFNPNVGVLAATIHRTFSGAILLAVFIPFFAS